MKDILSLKAAVVPAAILMIASPGVQAAVTLTDIDRFEGGLGNWEIAGDVAIVSSGGNPRAMLTTAFPDMPDDAPLANGALNVSGISPMGTGGDLEAFVGTGVGALDPDFVDQATEGSAMSITLNVASGDILRFDWNLLTRDVAGLDYGFISINGAIVILSQSSAASSASSGNYLMETGFTAGEHVFTEDGEVRISFGVVDVGDYATTSGLMIDNVQHVSSIPEPGSAALLGIFGVATAFMRKRRVVNA